MIDKKNKNIKFKYMEHDNVMEDFDIDNGGYMDSDDDGKITPHSKSKSKSNIISNDDAAIGTSSDDTKEDEYTHKYDKYTDHDPYGPGQIDLDHFSSSAESYESSSDYATSEDEYV